MVLGKNLSRMEARFASPSSGAVAAGLPAADLAKGSTPRHRPCAAWRRLPRAARHRLGHAALRAPLGAAQDGHTPWRRPLRRGRERTTPCGRPQPSAPPPASGMGRRSYREADAGDHRIRGGRWGGACGSIWGASGEPGGFDLG